MEAVVEIHGYNGGKMTIAGPNEGAEGVHLASGVEGLMDPEVSFVKQSPGNRPGAKSISHRILERTLIFRVTILNNEKDEWSERDYQWRRLWAYDEDTEIRVTTPVYGTRVLKAHLEEIEVDTEFDPHVNGATDVTMTVVADDPFWYAPDIVLDTVYNSKTGWEAITSRANRTPNKVYPIIELPGGTQWQIPSWYGGTAETIISPVINMPSQESGEGFLVNFDPGSRQLISTKGTLAWGRMNGIRFQGYIPPGKTNLTLRFKSSSSVSKGPRVILKQPFNRPWGWA